MGGVQHLPKDQPWGCDAGTGLGPPPSTKQSLLLAFGRGMCWGGCSWWVPSLSRVPALLQVAPGGPRMTRGQQPRPGASAPRTEPGHPSPPCCEPGRTTPAPSSMARSTSLGVRCCRGAGGQRSEAPGGCSVPPPRRDHGGGGGGGALRPLQPELVRHQPGPQVRQQLRRHRLPGQALPRGLLRRQVQRAHPAVLQPRAR